MFEKESSCKKLHSVETARNLSKRRIPPEYFLVDTHGDHFARPAARAAEPYRELS